MIKFHALDNSILSYGNEMEFNKEDEKAFLISFENATSACFVVAPIVTDFPLTLMPDNFLILLISITSL